MQPNYNSYTANDKPNKWSRKQLIILLGVVAGIIALWLAWTGIQTTYFRMSGTDPGLGNITTVTPYIHAKFSRVLSGDNLKISDPDKVLENYGLNDKVLELNLNLDKLKQGDKHTIVIESIQSKNGDKITNQKLSFTVKEGDFEGLNDDQKNIVVNRQDRFVYSPETIAFEGTDDLIDAGLSADQLIGLQEAIYYFSKKDNKEFDTVQFFRTSITHLENTDPVKATTAVTAEIDGISYAMQVDTWDITVVQLRVYDPQTNALLFTSDSIDKSSEQ